MQILTKRKAKKRNLKTNIQDENEGAEPLASPFVVYSDK